MRKESGLMGTTIQIEAGPETLHAITVLTEQLSMLNDLIKAQMPPANTQAAVADEEWLTMAEISKRYKICPNTVYSRVKEGRIERTEFFGVKSPRYRIRNALPTEKIHADT